MWGKGEVAEGQAGALVRMAASQSVTFKLTKKLADMKPIQAMPAEILARLGGKNQNRTLPPALVSVSTLSA